MIDYALNTTTGPAEPPVSLDDVKSQVYIDADIDSHDSDLTAFLEAATDLVEEEASISLQPRTYELVVPCFPKCGGRFVLPRPPILELLSIDYTSLDGTASSIAAEDLTIFDAGGGVVWYGNQAVWPITKSKTLVRVNYRAGFGEIPPMAVHAIRLLVGHWFRNREATITGTISSETPLAFRSLVNKLKTNHCFDQIGVVDG